MLARTRRRLNMGMRVLEFSRLHQDTSPAFVIAVARLQERLSRAEQLALQQNDGRTEVRAATARKAELRQIIMETHLDHLTSVADLASLDEPALRQKVAFPADATTYQAFQTAASGIMAEVESQKELLMKHGLSEEVLAGLKVALEEFEATVQRGEAGRLAHVGASAELVVVADQVVQIVKVMNGLVRIRHGSEPELLAAWESASSIFPSPRPEKPESGGTSGSGGEVKPAA
jgi:hypothetical protein